mmetsp:Transcript_43762/g.85890  ORF Transcript_43762/g.85890 Transcript_43762/m.85890 type:complete len:242 (-) Transcript_43762:201-926(-)
MFVAGGVDVRVNIQILPPHPQRRLPIFVTGPVEVLVQVVHDELVVQAREVRGPTVVPAPVAVPGVVPRRAVVLAFLLDPAEGRHVELRDARPGAGGGLPFGERGEARQDVAGVLAFETPVEGGGEGVEAGAHAVADAPGGMVDGAGQRQVAHDRVVVLAAVLREDVVAGAHVEEGGEFGGGLGGGRRRLQRFLFVGGDGGGAGPPAAAVFEVAARVAPDVGTLAEGVLEVLGGGPHPGPFG